MGKRGCKDMCAADIEMRGLFQRLTSTSPGLRICFRSFYHHVPLRCAHHVTILIGKTL